MTTKGKHDFQFLKQKKPWNEDPNPIWLASTISLQRNVEKFNFPGKLSTDRKQQIVGLICQKMLSIEGLTNPTFIKAEDIGLIEKEFIVEHFLSTHGYKEAFKGEGFIFDDSGEFLAILNVRDHIHMQLIDCTGELENTWSRLVKIETTLGKSLNYAFLPKFGFLTADPTECGTGLLATVYLQLSTLIHTGKIEEILDKYLDESLHVSGLQGSPTEIIGDILMIRNNYTFGVTEESIISSLRAVTTKLIVEEHSMRNKIKKEGNIDFKDKISRAYGILIHSYQIEAIEALNALSLIKLGVEMNWITQIDNRQINELFFNCRRAHLLCLCNEEKIDNVELAHKRAEMIHKALKKVKLEI